MSTFAVKIIDNNDPIIINTTLVYEEEAKEDSNQQDHYQMMSVDWLETEPNFLYTELIAQQEVRIRKSSKFGHLRTWSIQRLIVKSGDDLRLE